MNDDFLYNENVERFEEMLSKNENWYYDAEEIADIITFYIDINDVKNAQKALNYALGIHPENLDLQVKKVEVLIAKRKFTQAQDLITKLNVVIPSNTDLLIAQAKIFSIKKKYQKAIDFYEKALEESDEVEYLLSSIGNEFLNMDANEKALVYFKKVLEINLDDEYAFYSIMHCFNQLKNPAHCIKFLLEYIDSRPYSDYAWYNLGLEYKKQRNFSEAIRAFDYAILINEKFLSAYWQKANALEKTTRYDEAVKVYEESLQYDDTPSFTHLKIGKCYKSMALPLKALASFYNAIYDDPQMDKAWAEAAYVYAEMKNLDEAIYYLKKALELNPEHVQYIKKYITFTIENQGIDEALSYYDQLIQLEPENENNVLGKAELLLFTKAYRQVIDFLENYCKNHTQPEALYYLSFSYLSTHQTNLGFDLFKQAYTLAPELVKIYKKHFKKIFENPLIKSFLNKK
ncbi:MAG: tetratricopeptide repeat protein [Flavobacteriales bacterium]